jgi:hypothetical protein
MKHPAWFSTQLADVGTRVRRGEISDDRAATALSRSVLASKPLMAQLAADFVRRELARWLRRRGLPPEIQGAVAVMGQGIGNAFAQAGQAMQTSRVADELDGLIENGVRFDTTVLPGLERLGGALANAGSQKGAVDGLADGIAGIEDGLSGAVSATVPFEGALNTALAGVFHLAPCGARWNRQAERVPERSAACRTPGSGTDVPDIQIRRNPADLFLVALGSDVRRYQ